MCYEADSSTHFKLITPDFRATLCGTGPEASHAFFVFIAALFPSAFNNSEIEILPNQMYPPQPHTVISQRIRSYSPKWLTGKYSECRLISVCIINECATKVALIDHHAARKSPPVLEVDFLAQVHLALVFTPQLNQHKFIGNYRAGHTQHNATGQVEELHAGQGDRVGGHFLVKATQLQAPTLSRHHPNVLHGAAGLVVDLRGEKNHREGASNEQDEGEPEVEGVKEGRAGPEEGWCQWSTRKGIIDPLTACCSAVARR